MDIPLVKLSNSYENDPNWIDHVFQLNNLFEDADFESKHKRDGGKFAKMEGKKKETLDGVQTRTIDRRQEIKDKIKNKLLNTEVGHQAAQDLEQLKARYRDTKIILKKTKRDLFKLIDRAKAFLGTTRESTRAATKAAFKQGQEIGAGLHSASGKALALSGQVKKAKGWGNKIKIHKKAEIAHIQAAKELKSNGDVKGMRMHVLIAKKHGELLGLNKRMAKTWAAAGLNKKKPQRKDKNGNVAVITTKTQFTPEKDKFNEKRFLKKKLSRKQKKKLKKLKLKQESMGLVKEEIEMKNFNILDAAGLSEDMDFENKHPRDDSGKFSSKGSSGKTNKGKEMASHARNAMKALKIEANVRKNYSVGGGHSIDITPKGGPRAEFTKEQQTIIKAWAIDQNYTFVRGLEIDPNRHTDPFGFSFYEGKPTKSNLTDKTLGESAKLLKNVSWLSSWADHQAISKKLKNLKSFEKDDLKKKELDLRIDQHLLAINQIKKARKEKKDASLNTVSSISKVKTIHGTISAKKAQELHKNGKELNGLTNVLTAFDSQGNKRLVQIKSDGFWSLDGRNPVKIKESEDGSFNILDAAGMND